MYSDETNYDQFIKLKQILKQMYLAVFFENDLHKMR